MTVIYNMSIDRADKPWIGDRRLTETRRASRRSLATLARSLAAGMVITSPVITSPVITNTNPSVNRPAGFLY